MSLRQLQRKAAAFISGDGPLIKALQSELSQELSSPQRSRPLPSQVSDFKIEWDDARTQDVVLKRRDCGEEIAVSGLLGPIKFEGHDPIPRDVLMKVCVKKLGFEPVIHFDCRVFDSGYRIRSVYYHMKVGDLGENEYRGPVFRVFDTGNRIMSVYYHVKVGDLGENEYRGPVFSLLEPQLKKELKEYLVARGINTELTCFLLQHLHKKEHNQYVNWLHTLESFVSKEKS